MRKAVVEQLLRANVEQQQGSTGKTQTQPTRVGVGVEEAGVEQLPHLPTLDNGSNQQIS